jgi:hypothetical protein
MVPVGVFEGSDSVFGYACNRRGVVAEAVWRVYQGGQLGIGMTIVLESAFANAMTGNRYAIFNSIPNNASA